MVAGALKKVGVEAVVEGLGKFIGDVGKMNNSMADIGGQGNILTRTLGGVTNAFGYLADKIVDVATYALGQLLARAVEFIITQLSELVRETVAAAAEFQIMELRLKRLNFNSLIESGQDYTTAMKGAVQLTKEQLTWLQKLAVTTPFDATDIANVFTLARSYGFASESAKGLTEDIANFAAGMGLGNTEIERIIVNFGQMVQQGKVTQREMNDLARGAFVPVNDILKQMQKDTGLTGKAFDAFRNSAEGVDAFMKAFSTVVETRFLGASQEMARTFAGATANAQDFIKSLIGFGVVRPILDQVGGTIADLVDSLTTPERWDALTAAAGRVGDELAGLVGDILGLLPSTESLADGIVEGLNGLSEWIATNRTRIVDFFRGIGKTIETKVVPFVQGLVDSFNGIREWVTNNRTQIEFFFKKIGNIINNTVVKFVTDKLIPAFNTISEWVGKNSGLIQDFFLTLGEIIGDVFTNLTGVDVGGGLEGILGGVKGFMEWIVANQESVTNFVTGLTKLWAILQVVGFVFGIIAAIVTPLILGFLGLVAAVAGIIAVFAAIVSPAGIVVLALGLIVGAILNVIIWFNVFKDVVIPALLDAWNVWVQAMTDRAVTLRDSIIARVLELYQGVAASFDRMKTAILAKLTTIINNVRQTVASMVSAFSDAPWGTIGRDMMEGVATGIKNSAYGVIEAIVSAVKAAIEAAREALKAFSPSRVFVDIGESTMEGMAVGIERLSGMAKDAMTSAVNGMIAPAMNLPALTQQLSVAAPPTVSTTNNYTNNWSLTVHSSAPVEPVISDYQMLRSLAGG